MNFKREVIKDYYLYNTNIENVFINEYMAIAPGDYVKVYLFALMYAGLDVPMENGIIAKQLSLADEEVLAAWTYWEKHGVIRKYYPDPQDKFHYQVEFLNLKELLYGKKSRMKKREEQVPQRLKNLMDDEQIKDMYAEVERVTGRLFEGREPQEILNWISEYGATPDMVIYAYDYCTRHRKSNKYKYVGEVVKDWSGKGLRTIAEIENHLNLIDNRHYLYKRVLKSMGLLRNPTEEEMRIMDRWFDEMKFDIEQVLEACKKTSGISNPNINYINSILKAWHSGEPRASKAGSSPRAAASDPASPISRVMRSYEEDRSRNEAAAAARREEVYKMVPRIREIEEESRRISMEISRAMLSGGSGAKVKIRRMQEEISQITAERAFLLTENNFKIDYMDMTYSCAICRDTGILDTGERCMCFAERLKKLQSNGVKTDHGNGTSKIQ